MCVYVYVLSVRTRWQTPLAHPCASCILASEAIEPRTLVPAVEGRMDQTGWLGARYIERGGERERTNVIHPGGCLALCVCLLDGISRSAGRGGRAGSHDAAAIRHNSASRKLHSRHAHACRRLVAGWDGGWDADGEKEEAPSPRIRGPACPVPVRLPTTWHWATLF